MELGSWHGTAGEAESSAKRSRAGPAAASADRARAVRFEDPVFHHGAAAEADAGRGLGRSRAARGMAGRTYVLFRRPIPRGVPRCGGGIVPRIIHSHDPLT